jgi:hypothetical protein
MPFGVPNIRSFPRLVYMLFRYILRKWSSVACVNSMVISVLSMAKTDTLDVVGFAKVAGRFQVDDGDDVWSDGVTGVLVLMACANHKHQQSGRFLTAATS